MVKEHVTQPTTCPLEIKVELLLELMGLVAARLGRLADAESSSEKRAECLKALDIVLDKRFQFDPDDRGQVEALTAEFDSYAEILKRKLQRVGGISPRHPLIYSVSMRLVDDATLEVVYERYVRRALFKTARSSSQPRLVIVSGQPGAGKSRNNLCARRELSAVGEGVA